MCLQQDSFQLGVCYRQGGPLQHCTGILFFFMLQYIALCCFSCNSVAQKQDQPLLHQTLSIEFFCLSRTKIHPQIQERVCKTTQSSSVTTLAQEGQAVLWSMQFFMWKDNKLSFLLTLRKILVLPTCQLSSLPSTASEMLMQLCRVSFFSWCAKA